MKTWCDLRCPTFHSPPRVSGHLAQCQGILRTLQVQQDHGLTASKSTPTNAAEAADNAGHYHDVQLGAERLVRWDVMIIC